MTPRCGAGQSLSPAPEGVKRGEQLTIAGYADAYGYGRAEDILEVVDRVRNASQATRDIALELSGVGNLIVN